MKKEDGIALPVVAAMLLIVSLLAATFLATSVQLSDTTITDKNSKRALAAAEAGLQTAIYRMNQIRPVVPAAQCLGVAPVAPVAGECPDMAAQSLGNGASYRYWVTPAGSAAACVALPGVPTTPALDRCVTSVGTVNGVNRRVQTRLAVTSASAPNIFLTAGLVGKSLVYAYNSVTLTSDIGSNARVELINSITVEDDQSISVGGKVKLLAGGTYSYQNSVTVEGGTETVATPFDIPAVDFEAVEATNNNAALPASLFVGNRSLRRFRVSNGVTATIPAGNYHFCNVLIGDGAKVRFSHTAQPGTKFYVDSPSRPGSLCTGADGTFGADNSVEINKEVGEREELFDVYMYGTPTNDTRTRYSWCGNLQSPPQAEECRSDFMLDNSVKLWGSVYAPNSTVQAHNSVEIFGGIAADKIRFYNSVKFKLTGPVRDETSGSGAAGAATRKGWLECKPERSVASDPESGC